MIIYNYISDNIIYYLSRVWGSYALLGKSLVTLSSNCSIYSTFRNEIWANCTSYNSSIWLLYKFIASLVWARTHHYNHETQIVSISQNYTVLYCCNSNQGIFFKIKYTLNRFNKRFMGLFDAFSCLTDMKKSCYKA